MGQADVVQQGKGTQKEPYVYLLPGMEMKWRLQYIESLGRMPAGGARRPG